MRKKKKKEEITLTPRGVLFLSICDYIDKKFECDDYDYEFISCLISQIDQEIETRMKTA